MPLYKKVTILMESKPVKIDIPYVEQFYSELLDKIRYYENNVMVKLQQSSEFNLWF